MREKTKEENVIETKNVELENNVAKLLSENERLCKEINHVKQVFKDQFDSIKKTRVRNKEQIKGKEIVDIATQIPSANTIVPGIAANIPARPTLIVPRNEQADILQGIVEQAKVEQPLDKELDFACRIRAWSNCYSEDNEEKPCYDINEVPSELPKVSLVNVSLKKLKFHLAQFDSVVKKRTTLDARIEAQLQDKDITIYKLKEIIKSMTKEKNVKYDYCEIETKNVELENSVAKLLSKNERLCKEINHVKQIFKDQFDLIKKTCVLTKEQSDSLIDKLNLKSAENEDLKAQIQDKVFVITSLKNDLRKLKGKEIVDIAAQTPSAYTIVPGMFKLDLEPLAPMLLQNREAHIDYLNAKKVVVTPKTNIKKVRFAKPLISSRNIKQIESSKISDSNTPVLSPTGLKCSTSNYGSKPTGNKKNDRISLTPSRNMKNKVEAQPRKVNKKNSVFEPIRDVDVKNSLLNANSEPICATCKKSMFDGFHDMCRLDFVENVNSRKTFTIVGNSCPLTRITSANVVPPKNTTSHSVETQKLKLKVYSRKSKNGKNVGSSKKAKIVESKNANHSEPNHTWGSNATDIPSYSSLVMIGCPDCSLVSGLQMFETYNREPLSAHELSSKTKSWLWQLRLLHLNFGTLNKLAKDGLARGIPRLKFQKDHLCSTCALGKSKKSSHQPKAKDTNQEKLYLLHIDLCGPICVVSINGKRYILVIVDDYSRSIWVRFLRTKNEAPEAMIKCIKNIQVRLNATVRNVRTYNGTEFVNQTPHEFYENVGMSHQTSVARTP
ncbi:retrovirus-related pol polyprotein from transposon TNT 1-94 [Tanacetum coccineum]